MGVHAARQATQIVDHVATVLGIEVLCAAQALDMRRPLKASRGVEAGRRADRVRVDARDGSDDRKKTTAAGGGSGDDAGGKTRLRFLR